MNFYLTLLTLLSWGNITDKATKPLATTPARSPMLLGQKPVAAISQGTFHVTGKTYSTIEAATSELQTIFNSAGNLVGPDCVTKDCGYELPAKEAIDRNLKTVAKFSAVDKENTAFWDLGGEVRVNKIVLFLYATTPEMINIPINLWISENQLNCAPQDNSRFAILVAQITFTSLIQSISIELGTKGYSARFVSLSHFDNFWRMEQRVKTPLSYVSELAVFGKTIRPTNFKHTRLPKPRENPPNHGKPNPFSDTVQVATVWEENVDSPMNLYTIGMGTLVPYGKNTQCVLACGRRCHTAIGAWHKNSRARFVVTLHFAMIKHKRKVWLNAKKNICPDCSQDNNMLTNQLPASVQSNQVLFLNETEFKFTKENVDKLRRLLDAGQPMLLLLDWTDEVFENRLKNGRELQNLLDELQVDKVPLVQKTTDGWCWRKDFFDLPMVSYNFVREQMFGVYMHSAITQEFSVPDGSDLVPSLRKSSYNALAYAVQWFRDFVPCLKQAIPAEIVNAAYSLNMLVHGNLGQPNSVKAYWPGMTTFPPSPSPQAKRDAVMVRVVDRTGNKLISMGVGSLAGQVVAVRLLSVKNTEAKKCAIRHFSYSDDLSKMSTLKRMPLVTGDDSFHIQVNKLAELSWMFSGPVFFHKQTNNPNTTFPFVMTLAISNVYSMALYDQRNPKNRALFELTYAQTVFPHVVLTGDRVTQCGEIRSLHGKSYEQISAAMKLLDDWFKIDCNYKNKDPYKSRGEVFSYDWQINLGFMHSGYPIEANRDSFFLDGIEAKKTGQWGHCHEMGHNLNPSEVILTKCAEVTNNVLCWVNYKVTKIEVPMYEPGTRFCEFAKDRGIVDQSWRNKTWPWDSKANYEYFCYFGWKFGIGVNGNAWDSLVNDPLFKEASIKSWSKEDKYAYAMSMSTGFNIAIYHEFMGIPVASEAAERMKKDFPKCWLPSGDIYADQVKDLVAKFQKDKRIKCDGVAFQVKPRVDYSRYLNVMDRFLELIRVSFKDNTEYFKKQPLSYKKA